MLAPHVSVIIPSINREKHLKQTLTCLEKQVGVRFESIVIHQSEYNSLKSSPFQHNISFIKSDLESASVARNIGIDNSKGEILLFIDDDVLITDEYFVYKHFRHYSDNKIPGVVGRSIEKGFNALTYSRSKKSFNKDIGFFYFPQSYGSGTFSQSGRSNNLSVRRALAVEVGGMDENYPRGAHREETDFCLRVSRQFGNFIYDPNSVLTHLNEFTGGIRSWNDNDYLKAKHNMVGAIYFNLKMAPLRYKHEYIFATLRYFILNKTILTRPQLYYPVVKRVLSSYAKAYKLYKSGPKYL